MVSLFTNLKKKKMYNLTEEEKQKIHTALICASDSGTLDEFTKEELRLINESESIVNKLTIPNVSQQRELLLAFGKWYNNNEIIKPTSFVLTDDIEMFLANNCG